MPFADPRVDIDEFVLRHARVFGMAVLSAAAFWTALLKCCHLTLTHPSHLLDRVVFAGEENVGQQGVTPRFAIARASP